MANPLVSFLLRHAGAGVLAGWTSLGGLLWLDVGRLWTLITTDPGGLIALVMLASGFAVTFASAAMGAAIMGLGRAPPPARLGRKRELPARPASPRIRHR